MGYERTAGRPRVSAYSSAIAAPDLPIPGAAILRLQRLAGNSAVGRVLEPDPARINELETGAENHLGERIGISSDLLELFETTAAPAKPEAKPQQPAQSFAGSAFVKGKDDANEVDANDVRQGDLGDCYLCAAMMAVARANPAKIKSLIAKQPDGTYNVTLYLKAGVWSKAGGAQVVNVTADFPGHQKDGKAEPQYARQGDEGADGPELWAMLIEKAYAQVKGGYQKIVSGNAGAAAEMLGAGKATRHEVARLSATEIAKTISEALANKWPVICDVRKPDKDEPGEKMLERAGANIVAGAHSYVPRAVDVSALTVDLQNPWGTGDITALKIDGPFKRFFVWIHVVKP